MRKKFLAALVLGVFVNLGVYAADVTIGTGTSTWNYPLSTNYHDARTQTIYLASEIGGAKTLTSLALNVSTKPGQAMNNFTIRLKHTTLSAYGTSPTWESTGWTTVYQASKTISTTGWATFIFAAPFAYNGTQNLMVDISFNNPSYSSNGYCYYTSSSVSRSIYYRTNSSYGDPLTWTSRTPTPGANNSYSNIRLGYATATVPNVVGMTQADAQTAITSAELTVGTVTVTYHATIPAGYVISQLPAAGQSVSSGTSINLVISLGAPFCGGTGTEGDPYLICTKEHLLNPLIVNGTDEGLHFKLMNDIDFEGQQCPTLFSQRGLRGVFDGNHKCIKNISRVNGNSFIGGVSDKNAVLKNLTLQSFGGASDIGPDDIGMFLGAGLLVGWGNSGTIDNCHVVAASISGQDTAGITYLNFGVIRNTSFSGIIRGNGVAGIAVINTASGIIEDSAASVNMVSFGHAGGAVLSNYGLIRNCSTNSRIESQATGWQYAGGLVAGNYGVTSDVLSDPFDAAVYGDGGGIILDSHSSCDVVANNCNAVGGLVGISWSGAIKNCSASGSVTGYGYTGGLIGTIQTFVGDGSYPGFKYKGIIENCYATGNVNGNNRLGGFAGENGNCTIRNCYSTGNVTGSWRMGGFVGCVYDYPYAGGGSGHGPSIIDRCYSVGQVSGWNETGGLLGARLGSHVITSSFWDTQTSGWTYSAGGTGKTTAQMKTLSTFTSVGWDFINGTNDDLEHIWFIREGQEYPRLLWEIENGQSGLFPEGFVTISKTRVGRTNFEYELAVRVRNSNAFAMNNVQMKLMDWDAAVQSVSDDSITIDTIPAGATVTSTDRFKIVVNRSTLINSSRLTCELTYYTVASGDQVQQAMMSMLLSEIDAGVSGDITGDGKVNLEDLAVMSAQWDTIPGNPSADIAEPLDDYVGVEDLMYLAEKWMK